MFGFMFGFIYRSVDLSPMLMHSSTYLPLIHDLLEFKLNRVTLDANTAPNSSAPGNKRKTYDLNSNNDKFFNKYAGVSFPEVVEANEKELVEVSVCEYV